MPRQVVVNIPTPRYRYLQVFAFDPSLNLGIETAVINHLKLGVRWEDLDPGPIGEYLEVVDVDPASNMFYPPVDLDDAYLLVQDGLPPSEGTPQFHQQMVYAVAMKTIQNFEEALGRKVLWSPYQEQGGTPKFVKRLRIYPHALRQANAYYSPAKKALLFGYFPASTKDAGRNLPGGMVFTCLSHDIITHETTHALMDGLHPYFGEPSNPDTLALHEAFADIVALFQRFSYPEVLRSQIAGTRGDLADEENLLVKLASQFGEATGKRGALRSAIGREPNPAALQQVGEPHDRGSILVAAVFNAFLTIYKQRISDLKRIASGGTGVLQEGAIHPDLVNRMADEAAQISQHVLTMCIRALDYCPPVDVTFGEYLRAMITADLDINPSDRHGYRIAMIESFRKYGIYPPMVRNLSQESLLWHPPQDEEALSKIFDYEFIQKINELVFLFTRLESKRETIYITDVRLREMIKKRILEVLGRGIRRRTGRRQQILMDRKKVAEALERSLNVNVVEDPEMRSICIDPKTGRPELDVNSVRFAHRVDESGQPRTDLVIEISQCRWGYLEAEKQSAVDRGTLKPGADEFDFIFRGGATMLIDMGTGRVRYVINKGVDSNRRLEIQRRYLSEGEISLAYTYRGNARLNYFLGRGSFGEPFALLHGDSLIED